MILSYPVALRSSAARFWRSRENIIEQCSLISSITGRSRTGRTPRCASSCNPRGKPPSAFPPGRAVTEDMPPANPPYRPQPVRKVRHYLVVQARVGVHRPPPVRKVRRYLAVLTADSTQARAQEKSRFKVLHYLAVQARAGVPQPQANVLPVQAVPPTLHLLPLWILPSTPPETVGVLRPQPLRICQETSTNLY